MEVQNIMFYPYTRWLVVSSHAHSIELHGGVAGLGIESYDNE